MFKALMLTESQDSVQREIVSIDESQLPAGDVLVEVKYSSLNYKDGLAITGKGKIVRDYPMVPGIDFAGTVISSQHPKYNAGDSVLLTGWGVGERHWGGMAEKAQVNGDWLVPMPANLDSRKAMMVGTAGFTAMLCVQALQDAGIRPKDGEILVTGASGGVGSVTVTLLAALGYQVVALTGRASQNSELLQGLGASRVIDREQLQQPARALESQQWAGVVDTLGSGMLAKVLAQMKYGGVVTACGLAAGADLPTTMMPFILRNVRLIGIDSVMCPSIKRQAIWQRLASLLPAQYFNQACSEITLAQVPDYADAIVEGKVTGRVVIWF